MPFATVYPRGQANRHGRRRFNQATLLSGAPALSFNSNFTSPQQSNAAHHPPRSPMAEHMMPRVRGRVHALVMRRARHVVTRPRRNHVASTRAECSPYALRRDRRITPGITRPPASWRVMTSRVSRVGCMPLLDCGPSLAHLSPSGPYVATFNLRHALRYRPPPRSGRTRRLVPLQSDAFATRRGRSFNQ